MPASNGKSVRALDPGTGSLKTAWLTGDGASVQTAKIRNVFFEVPNDEYSRRMMANLKVAEFEIDGKLYVAGEDAYGLAKTFGKELRRPMSRGVISPGESDAIPMIGKMIDRLLRTAGEHPGDQTPVVYSCPADPVDVEFDAVFHRSVIEGVLAGLGYSAKPIIEGHAVVLAELAADDFTGIGISCGGGMFNICAAYKSVPVVLFSTTRAGDYVDSKAATVCGDVRPRMTAVKESGMDLAQPTRKEEFAIEAYYRDVIRYTLETVRRRFETGKDMPRFDKPITTVLAGGTSMIKGFGDLFKSELARVKMPFSMGDVRVAPDPQFAVSRGCLVAASL